MKICGSCKIPKEEKEFGNNKTRKDGLQPSCKLCIRTEQITSYNKNKQDYYNRVKRQTQRCTDFVDDFRKNNSCKKCGENRYWILDFHHIDPKQKDFNIGTLRKTGLMNKIKQEINKCILLCRNCHSDFHYNERKDNITIEEYLKVL